METMLKGFGKQTMKRFAIC